MEYITFIALVVAGWYFYSKNPKAWKDFASKFSNQNKKYVRDSTTSTSTAASKKRKVAKSKGNQKGLTFERERKPPEVDSAGRVIVRLAMGGQIELGVRIRIDEVAIGYLLGKPKDDEIARSVRARVLSDAQNKRVTVSTPDGHEIGEVISEMRKAIDIFGPIEVGVKKASKGLAGRQLVFDVSLKVEGDWQEDSEEESGWSGDVHSAVIRIKDPAGIDVL